MSRLQGHYARTHVYDELDYERPKFLFEVAGESIASCVADRVQACLLDVGGASGAFAHYLSQRIYGSQVSCLDFDPELCRIGRERLAHIHFLHGDANDMHGLHDHSFDAVSMLGTLSVFDDFRPSLQECLRVCRQQGRVVVVAQFNDHPVDALIRYRYSGENDWNTGYNLFSRSSIARWLQDQERVRGFEFRPFELPFDLAPQDDPIRSWTERTVSGGRQLVNGLNLFINIQILEIEVGP